MARHTALILFAWAFFGTGCGPDSEVDLSTQPAAADEIVGGATFTRLPAVGALLYDGQFYCSGTLIGKREVVTAAHCVRGFDASRIAFAIGPSVNKPEYVFRAARAAAHPSFSPSRLVDDIGIVVLADDAPVDPMPVLADMDDSFVGEHLLFVGYGVDDGVTHSGAGTKRAVSIEIADVFPWAFRYNQPGRNTCNGDSGGPAFYRTRRGNYLLAGVTSYGDASCTLYGVDTRADQYLDFLGVPGAAKESL
jgi:secreted trypsin-like serine protease